MPRAGTRLAGDYYGLVWAGAGDQDYKRDCLGLANTQSATEPCIHTWGSILHWCIPSLQIVFLYSESVQTYKFQHSDILYGLSSLIVPTHGNHCPANSTECAWYDIRPNARWVGRTYKCSADCPAIESTLYQGADYDRMSVYSDIMHDKYLGTDKVSTPPISSIQMYIGSQTRIIITPKSHHVNETVNKVWTQLRFYNSIHTICMIPEQLNVVTSGIQLEYTWNEVGKFQLYSNYIPTVITYSCVGTMHIQLHYTQFAKFKFDVTPNSH